MELIDQNISFQSSSLRVQEQEKISKKEDKNNQQPPAVDVLLLAYMAIYESVGISSDTAAREAKAVELNANTQNKLINAEQAFSLQSLSKSLLFSKVYVLSTSQPSYTTWTPKANLNQIIEEVQNKNQSLEAMRSTFEEKITLARRMDQLGTTEMNTDINETGQRIQQGSNFMNIVDQLTNLINR